MIVKAPHTSTALTRRGVLHGTLRGIVGFAAWQGWPCLQRAMAQKGEPARADDVGDAYHPGPDMV